MSEIKERLIEYLDYKGESKSEFGRKVGVSSAYITSIRKSIQPEKVENIALNYPDLNTAWLLTGEGSMLRSGGGSVVAGVEEAYGMIPLLPVAAQGGTLSDFAGSVNEGECERVFSPVAGAELAMPVSGDSMMPEYPPGSQIFIKKINERAFIDWGKVYVLDTCNGTIIKRLLPPTDGDASKVRCVSINPEYPPFDVAFEDIYGVYRVLVCMCVK